MGLWRQCKFTHIAQIPRLSAFYLVGFYRDIDNAKKDYGFAVRSTEMKLRLLAVCTGLVTLGSAAITVLYLPWPILILMGAVVSGRWPHIGRGLMWIGAAFLSVFVLPLWVLLLPAALHSKDIVFSHKDLMGTLISIGWIGTLVFLPIFDVALVVDGFRKRK